MSTTISFLTPKFQTTFLLGFLLIILYAKDKFNMPTYDREAMGPFAQLPPQSLTIDVRYRQGRMWYVILMLCLYTAISFVGPTTFFQDIQAATTQLGPQFQWGLQFKEPEVWPVAAATFLVGAGAAQDTSILGRIELFIRQYAHKTAYIPRAVGDLAYSLRNLNVGQWLTSNPYSGDAEKAARQKDLKEREDALSFLIGSELLAEVTRNPHEESDRTSWVRANILFHTLQQIFNKRSSFVTPRLESLVDLPENREIFERLRTTRQELRARLPAAEAAAENGAETKDPRADTIFNDVQRFLKDTSLMIAVLLAQSARNPIHLNDQLDRLGFEGVDLRDRAGHLAYQLMVALSILVGAVLAVALSYLVLVAISPIRIYFRYSDEVGTHLANVLAPVASSMLAYLVAFRMIDYLRDRSLDALDWREDADSYVKTGFSASVAAGLISLLLINVLFSLGGISLWRGFVDLLYAVVLQISLAGITVGFSLYYLRRCAQTNPPGKKIFAALKNPVTWGHAIVAAIIVGMLNGLMYIHQVRSGPANSYDVALSYARPVYDQLVGGQTQKAGEVQTEMNAIGNGLEQLSSEPCMAILRQPQQQAPGQTGNATPPDAAENPPAGAAAANLPDNVPCTNRVVLIRQIQGRIAAICGTLNQALLKVEGTSCVSGKGGTSDAAQDAVLKFTGAFASLSRSVGTLEDLTTSNRQVQFAMTFSAIIAFFLALAYALGFQVARWLWLYSEAGRADGLVETLQQQDSRFASNEQEFLVFLRTPIPALNRVTPIEAVHYEDYRIKLYSLLKRKSLNLDKLLQPAPPLAEAGPGAAQRA